MQPVLSMKNITKRFPGVIANDNVNFELYCSEIHALVGENGAGKSTLMKILFGLYQPDEGQIIYDGRKVVIDSPNKSIELGIGMVHQHFKLVQPLTVTENIILGNEPKKGITLDITSAEKEVEELSSKYRLMIDAKARIEDIPVGMQQRVEILKTLYRGADVIILDEPTAVLTPQETKELFQIMKALKSKGKAIIFITHKLNEVMEIADRVTVMRKGRTVASMRTDETSVNELAEKMVGRKVLLKVEKKPARPGEVVLKLDSVSALNDRGLLALKNISLEVKKGEILGIAGVEGNGQTELIEVIIGLRKVMSGRILLNSKEITNLSPRKIKDQKVACIPEDRHKRGIVLDFSIDENSVLSIHYRKPFAKGIWLDYKNIREHALNLIKKYDVRTPGSHVLVRTLSGGNQQKLIVGRELETDPVLILASQPTRGVDIGAIEFIHKQIINERDKGKAVLLVSAELQEVMNLSDRIAVIYEGEIVAVLDSSEATEERLGLLMAGVKNTGGGENVEHKYIS